MVPAVSRHQPPSPVTLQISGDPTSFEMRAPGVSHQELGNARRHIHIEESLDLHGDLESVARARLESFLFQAVRLGRRCVLIVHGKGVHSDGYSVLRNMVIDQLAGPLSGWVHSACSADKKDGGDGATLLLLRTAAARRAPSTPTTLPNTSPVMPNRPIITAKPEVPQAMTKTLVVSVAAAAQAATSMSPLSSALVAALRPANGGKAK
jgi:DNA-nicking Smr family endonuclease